MKKIALTIIQGLCGTIGFGILFFYGYSSKTAFTFGVLLVLPYILSRIAIMKPQANSIEREHSKMTVSSFFTFLTIVFGFLASVLAYIKIDKNSLQAIMESKPFLIALYFCFISGLIADTAEKPKNIKYGK